MAVKDREAACKKTCPSMTVKYSTKEMIKHYQKYNNWKLYTGSDYSMSRDLSMFWYRFMTSSYKYS